MSYLSEEESRDVGILFRPHRVPNRANMYTTQERIRLNGVPGDRPACAGIERPLPGEQRMRRRSSSISIKRAASTPEDIMLTRRRFLGYSALTPAVLAYLPLLGW